MSTYLQSLASHLHDRSLLSDELKAALLEHDNIFSYKPLGASEPSIKINFGKYKGKPVSEVAQFDNK